MDYIAPRDMTVISTSGRSVILKKGVPTYCPAQMHKDLISAGVVPAEEIPDPVVDDGPGEPVVHSDRQKALMAAFEKILLRNKRGDFTASGVPHNAVLIKELGWSTITTKERDAAWIEFNLAHA